MHASLLKRVVVRNTSWIVVGQGVRIIIQALYFVQIARSLGVASYGVFVGVVALVGIVFPFGSLGSGNLLIRNVARNPKLFSKYWGRALCLTMCSGSVLLALVLLLSHFVLSAEIPLKLIALVGASDLLGLNIITLAAQSFQAFEQLHWTSAIWICMSGGRLAAAIALVHFYSRPSAVQWGYLYFTSNATLALLAVLLVSSRLGGPSFSWPNSSDELKEGYYFSISLSAETIYNDIDKTMLARLATLDATGIYGAAYRIVDVTTVPISALLYSSYPQLFRVGLGGIAPTFVYTKRLLFQSLAYASLACIGMLYGAKCIPYFLGPSYADSAVALRWLSILPMLKAMHYFLSDTLTGAGYQRLRSAIQAGVAIFNIIVNLWTIPMYSWRGAAWSSLASDGLLACTAGAAVLVLTCRRDRGMASSIKLVGGLGT